MIRVQTSTQCNVMQLWYGVTDPLFCSDVLLVELYMHVYGQIPQNQLAYDRACVKVGDAHWLS